MRQEAQRMVKMFAKKYGSKIAGCCGFTLVEIMIVVVILVIAAMIVVPIAGSASSVQIRSAANVIVADIEYAKSMAITKGQKYSVAFNTSADSYQIEDQNGVVIGHPVRKGFNYVMNFHNDSRLNKVDIVSTDFDSTEVVKFDYLGSPYNGSNSPLNSGTISLQAGATIITITVQPVTGFVTIEP